MSEIKLCTYITTYFHEFGNKYIPIQLSPPSRPSTYPLPSKVVFLSHYFLRFIFILFNYVYVHINSGAQRSEVSEPLKLEAGSYELRIKPGSSTRAVLILNCWIVSLALPFLLILLCAINIPSILLTDFSLQYRPLDCRYYVLHIFDAFYLWFKS